VRIDGGSFLAGTEADGFKLSDVTLSVKPGELLAVCGQVGSGKSTLFGAILGDVTCVAGAVSVQEGARIAYAAQTPYILNGTLRENIVFGHEWDPEHYKQVLDSCALWPDVKQLPDGEMTMIGERGVTLSGGQKQRVSLARCAYCKPDVVLFDDPLSALDSHTGKHVFQHLLSSQGMLAGAAKVLATHATQYLSSADAIAVLHEGEMVFQGPFEELCKRQEERAAANEDDPLAMMLATLSTSVQESKAEEAGAKDGGGEGAQGGAEKEKKAAVAKELTEKEGALMVAEEREVGKMGLKVLLGWVEATGGWPWLGSMLLFLVLDRLTYISIDWVLVQWCAAADTEMTIPIFDVTLPQATPHEGATTFNALYGAIALVNVFFVVLRTEWFGFGGANAAISLFKSMIARVVRAPLEFFETNPMGRIVNRFSFDTEQIDFQLVIKLNAALASLAWMVSGIFVMISINPWTATVLGPCIFIYYRLQSFYRHSSIDLQRLDSVSRSPIQAHFSESLDGAATIRAFGKQQRFITLQDELLDKNNECLVCSTGCSRWLGVRLDHLGACVQFSVALFCWLARENISSGFVGMAMIWAHNFQISLNFNVVFSTESEAMLTSVERVQEFSRLQQEAALESAPGLEPEPSWPQTGTVEFKSVSMRYREGLPLALKQLSFKLDGGLRVGVVGRTGAGKSTLAVVLLRLRGYDGQILVDGVALKDIGLQDVRSRGLCIIPQDAVMFSGTLRDNLDPFTQFTDSQIWKALEQVRLAEVVKAAPDKLLNTVADQGSNFSLGQRQLFCLARALLRQPKVLVLDEATASVVRACCSGDTVVVDVLLLLFLHLTRPLCCSSGSRDGRVYSADNPCGF
jgi:ABC-type multidrug transport system fused ATPase/permease subunit